MIGLKNIPAHVINANGTHTTAPLPVETGVISMTQRMATASYEYESSISIQIVRAPLVSNSLIKEFIDLVGSNSHSNL